MPAEMITISNEDEAIALLKELTEGFEFGEEFSVKFESWPRFVIRIKGLDFDGTIPTRIMPTLLKLQSEVYRAYCIATYGNENLRQLTKKDREQLELMVKVDKGSSLYETIMEEPVLKILKDATSRMSPEQLTATLIIFGLSVTSVFFWKMWLNNRVIEKKLDQTIELSRLEKEKMEVVRQAAQQFPSGKLASSNMGDVRNSLLTKLKPNDKLEVGTEITEELSDDTVVVSGEEAVQLTRSTREKSVERLIDDEFFLRSADFSKPERVRVEVERISDKYTFKADVPLGVLDHEQAEALKNDSWNRKNIKMNILVNELRGKYTSAKVISVTSEI